MIIDTEGNRLEAWFRVDGVVIEDLENGFAICVEYTPKQKESYKITKQCKKNLSDTDYMAAKYSEGWYTEEEYAPMRNQREEWRELIRQNTFEEPTLTREQMDEIEEKARRKGVENG